MNRRTFVYLFISLTMVALVFGVPPFAVAETSNAPVGLTETPTPPPTNTPIPNTPIPNTPVPNTPVPNTPVPNTPVPNTSVPNTPVSNTPVPNTSVPALANTPTAPAVVGLPNTGGAAPQGGAVPWILVFVIASAVCSLGTLAFGLRIRARRFPRR